MDGRDTHPLLQQSPRWGQKLSAGIGTATVTDRLAVCNSDTESNNSGRRSPTWHLLPVKPARQEQV